MWKNSLISLIGVLVLIVGLIVFIITNKDDGITGEEWIEKQETTFKNIQAITNEMDKVYTLYISGSMTPENFKNEVMLLKNEYYLTYTAYCKLQKENTVGAGKHSYITKRGSDAIDNIFNYIDCIMSETLDKNNTPLKTTEVAYIYMAYKQQIEDAYYDYFTSKALVELETLETTKEEK